MDLGLFLVAFACLAAPPAEPLRAAVAISLREPLSALSEKFQARTSVPVDLVFGSSGQLLSQIRQGAPIDVIIAASVDITAALEKEKLIDAGRVAAIAGNRLVLAIPRQARFEPASFQDLANPSIRRIVIGDPATVPAGHYANEVLNSLKLADKLRGRIVFGSNAQHVLSYVANAEVDAGIVYATDAAADPSAVRIIAVADAKWHRPIVYPAAVLRGSSQGNMGQKLIEFLTSPESQKVFSDHGYLARSQLFSRREEPANASQPAASQPSARKTPNEEAP